MDGVLYDSMKFHAIAWNKAMAKYGIDMPEIEGYLYEGMRGVETITIKCREQLGREISEEEAFLGIGWLFKEGKIKDVEGKIALA